MPIDVGSSPTFFEDTDAEVMLRDGSWVWCRVIGQRKDRHGRWCVGICYYPSSTIGESGGWYLYDPQLIRRGQDLAIPQPVVCKHSCPEHPEAAGP